MPLSPTICIVNTSRLICNNASAEGPAVQHGKERYCSEKRTALVFQFLLMNMASTMVLQPIILL